MTPLPLPPRILRRSRWRVTLVGALTVLTTGSLIAAAGTGAAAGGFGHPFFSPGNLLVSGSVYVTRPNTIVPGVTVLPPGCTTGCATANSSAAYPGVWNNDSVDGSFGITSPIFLEQLTPSGRPVNTFWVPAPRSFGRDHGHGQDGMVTSFSSKSELALNLSASGRYVTFMGYESQPSAIDVSNSNTPGDVDATNPVPASYYRVVAQVGGRGQLSFTRTNAYSGNNGRAAYLNDANDTNLYYTAGNAGNGANPQPDGIIIGAGSQLVTPQYQPLAQQQAGQPTPLGSFNITQLGDPPDKIGKDTNFRGLTVSGNVVYYTKGSGGNGVNTVYFIDTTGTACPHGVGLPVPGAPLPASPIAYNPAVLQTEGVTPYNMCILQGFPTALKSTTAFPFGLWFAGPDTLYVADEGNGDNTFDTTTGTYSNAAAQTTAGLQKWVFNGTSWNLAYTLSAGLGLGVPYAVRGYPTGDNAGTGLPWAPATDGLRNVTGRVNPDGSVTIWAITSTVSGNGDQGADPNKLVTITDQPGATSPALGESFQTVQAAGSGQVLRGVSFTPGTGASGR
jgi:hypothetical protein